MPNGVAVKTLKARLPLFEYLDLYLKLIELKKFQLMLNKISILSIHHCCLLGSAKCRTVAEMKCYENSIFTVRNEVVKVMFLHVSVPACFAGGIPACLAAGLWGRSALGDACSGGSAPGGMPAPRGVCSWGVCSGGVCSRGCPPKADGYCCGRYESYWNAFLFPIWILSNWIIRQKWQFCPNFELHIFAWVFQRLLTRFYFICKTTFR